MPNVKPGESPYEFCGWCTNPLLAEAKRIPDGFKCVYCEKETFLNVPSVAGLIVPILPIMVSGKKFGVWAIRREALRPGDPLEDAIALPAGFRIFNTFTDPQIQETWRKTAARETMEETGIECDADYVTHVLTESAHDKRFTGSRDLIIGKANDVNHDSVLNEFVPSDEVKERVLLFPGDQDKLEFSIHRRALMMYWNSYYLEW